MTSQIFEERAKEFARCRAYVLQAIHDRPGMTYVEIRQWIRRRKLFEMENIGACVRELARDLNPPLAIIRYDESHRVHALPISCPYPKKLWQGCDKCAENWSYVAVPCKNLET